MTNSVVYSGQSIKELELLGIKNHYRKHPLNRQLEYLKRDGIVLGILKFAE